MATPKIDTTLTQRSTTVSHATKSPMTSTSGLSAKVRMTLERAWRDVDLQFFEQTGKHLASSGPGQKAGVMEIWQAKYRADASSETRKHNQLAEVIQSVLDGVEIIGAFAAQAASTVFAPAGMCFNAFSFLIDIPRQIRKVYDSLQDLFEEVSDFLIRFKILKRIDDETSLDEDLVMNTNRVLISFVRICTLSIRLLEGSRLMIAAKVIFLKNDSGISAELDIFRRLTQSQSTLTGTVTLEHVLRSEQDVKSILASSFDMNAKITSLAAVSNDEKTRMVNRERLTIIGRKLFPRGTVSSIEAFLSLCADMNALPDTLEALKATTQWGEWMDQTMLDRRGIMITGPSNTGKSFLLEALKEKLDIDRQEVQKDAPSIYVCYHSFATQERLGDDRSYNLSVTFALRSIAFQVASQSTTYAAELESHLQRHENVYAIESIDKLWSILGLHTFSAPARSVLFVLLDGIDQEGDSMANAFLERLLDRRRQGDSDSVPNLRLRLFLTATTMPNINQLIPELNMQNLSKGLINAYITRELKRLRIFQDRDRRSVKRRMLVQEELPKASAGRFNIVRQKLEILRKAIHEDANEEELSKIIQADIELDENRQSQQVLERLEDSLQSQHIEHLNTLLMWTAYCERGICDLRELEAALYLSNGAHTLEPLVNKMRERFNEIFLVDGYGNVKVREPILQILKKEEDIDAPTSSANKPLFSLSISLQNASEKDIRRFIWDLNEEMVSGKFEFSKPQCSTRGYKININKIKAHLQITKSCLKLLNEGPQEATQGLLQYARDYLPAHLMRLRELCNRLPIADRSLISRELIQHLSDPYYLEHEHLFFGEGELWLESPQHMDSIAFWLDDPTTVAYLQPRERRWVKRAKESKHQAWYMSDVIMAVARRWSGWKHPKPQIMYESFREMYCWLELYIAAEKTGSTTVDASSQPLENVEPETEDFAVKTVSRTDERTSLQKATGVVDWVQARLNDDNSVRRNMLIGAILYVNQEKIGSVEYFSKCLADNDYRRNALLWLVRCHKSLRDMEAYHSTLMEFIAAMRMDKDRGEWSQKDVAEYVEALKDLANSYILAGESNRAIQLCEDALKEDEFDNDCWWLLVRSLCQADKEEQVLVLLDEWTRSPGTHGGKTPAQSFFEWTERYDDITDFMQLLPDVQDEKLLSSMAEMFEGAAAIAKVQQSPSYGGLLFCQGLANVLSYDTSKSYRAITLWEELTQSPQPADADVSWRRGWFHVAVNEHLVQRKFDDIRKTLRGGAELPVADVERTVTELRSYIRFTQKNYPPEALPEPGQDMTNQYVASIYVVMGRQDLARTYMSQDMADCLEIMSDDDPNNDPPAIREMFRIFCMTNDTKDAMSAWSLLDQYGTLWRRRISPLGRPCLFCQVKLDETESESWWFCKFCLRDFCLDCHEKHISDERKGKRRNYFCSTNHEFVKLRRWDYMEEEKAPGKVRIDCEIVMDGDGHEKRVGGQIVDISDWLERVRVKWGLPLPSSTTRAQK